MEPDGSSSTASSPLSDTVEVYGGFVGLETPGQSPGVAFQVAGFAPQGPSSPDQRNTKIPMHFGAAFSSFVQPPFIRSSKDTYHVFVGDLSNAVTAESLKAAFSAYNVHDARVVMDYTTGRTRGYGFACFKNREDAARAIEEKNGSWLGGRSVRVSWGSRGLQPDGTLPPTSSDRSQKSPGRRSSLQEIRTQSPITNTTVYIANIPQMQTDTEVARLFEPFGLILDIRQQWARGYAFVTMENHESASRAIHSLNGAEYCGRKLKCSWGREKWGYGMEAEPLIYDAFGNGFVGDPNALADGWVFPAMQQQYVDGSESDTESIPGGVTYPMYPQQVYFIPGMVAPQYAEAMY